MTKEKILELLEELKILESEKSKINSKISNLYEKLLPESFQIEDEYVDLEHLGCYTNYYFISKPWKVIGENHQTKEDAILDAWNIYNVLMRKK